VIYLRYAKAKDMVTVLQGASKNLSNEAARNAPSAGQVSGAPPAGDGGGGGGGGSALVDIQADDATNALVITAPPDLTRSLRSVIAQLDVRRAQVLVEAVIAEISAEKSAALGVQWGVGGNQGIGFTNFDAGASSLANVLGLATTIDTSLNPASGDPKMPDLSNANVPTGLQLGLGRSNFGLLISALAKDADANVLSTPTIVTLDNEEASIIVGQDVPFVTGSYTTSTSGGTDSASQIGNPFQTINRQKVGIKLKVKPQINEGNAIKLEIAQEVSNVVPSANSASQGPTLNTREINAIVLVEDGQILVLGGLIDDKIDESAQKVPVLGDVPVLGNLFRYRNTSKLKRNLMVFLHPRILRDTAQGTLHTSDKYSYIREQQLAARAKAMSLLPDAQLPVLKPREEVEAQGTLLNTQPTTPPVEEPPVALERSPAPSAHRAPPPAAGTPEPGFGDK
ncbi:MAG: type II secretion system secretin GspD, partial [Candidatus Contendobacter sp.]